MRSHIFPRHIRSSLLLAATLAVASREPLAQTGCPTLLPFSPYSHAFVYDLTAADLNGDGYREIVMGTHYTLTLVLNSGSGQFLSTVFHPPFAPIGDVATGDIDHDGDIDIVGARLTDPPTSTTSALVVYLNSNGTLGAPTVHAFAPTEHITGVALGDLDEDGYLDVVTGGVPTSTVVGVWLNDTAGGFVAAGSVPTIGAASTPVLADVDGDGHLDLSVGVNDAASPTPLQVNTFPGDGAGGFGSPLVRITSYIPTELVAGDLDDDGRADLVAVDLAQGVVRIWRQGATQSISTWIGQRGASLGDLDDDGDIDIVVGAHFSERVLILRNSGNGQFPPTPEALHVPGRHPGPVALSDLDADGDLDIAAGDDPFMLCFQNQGSCTSAFAICLGDGSGTNCPCANFSMVGALAGCRNSTGTGGRLRSTGTASVGTDSFVLLGASMPATSSVLWFQGSTMVLGGSGAVMGDGLRCAGGTVRRLRIVTNSGGASQFPGAGDPPISVLGAVSAGTTLVYQGWYRNVASYCTPAAFNLTNGLSVTWGP